MRSERQSGGSTGTRQRIVDLLRRGSLTANEMARRLGVTHNAVRVHLTGLQHDGLVVEHGARRTASRPAALYELAPGAEASFSRAYAPFVAHMVEVLAETLPDSDREHVMRTVGRRIAADLPPFRGDVEQRVAAASSLLHDLGGLNEVVRDDGDYLIRGHGCLLGEATHSRPDACRSMESLLAELVQAPVTECCERGARPACRFRIGTSKSAQ